MNTQQVNQLVSEQAEKASQSWFKSQCLNPYAAMYLYYRRGELGVFEESAPEGWTLGLQSRLSPNMSRMQIKRLIAETAQRLPFLPV